ncbi:MAG: DUF1735 domain-containing protein [Ginsengibacter sp.]
MTYKLFKNIIFSSAAIAMLIISGCTKPYPGYTDFSQVSDFVILLNAGTGNFKASNVSTAKDTAVKTITVDLASANNNNGPVTVTLGLDPTAIASYNGANGSSYQALPAGSYKILSPTVTIPAGQHYGTTSVEIYIKKLDASVSYLLPVTITDGGGKKLSSNQNTIYYNVIGNPLAGTYSWDYSRFNSSDTTGALGGGSFTGQMVVISPITGTSVLFPDSYTQTFISGAGGFALSFTNTAGVFSNFSVAMDPQTVKDIPAGGFTVASGPKLVGYKIVGDASTKYAGSTFRFYISYVNSSGGSRTLIDNFVKQ